jgi:hypothetical protein
LPAWLHPGGTMMSRNLFLMPGVLLKFFAS